MNDTKFTRVARKVTEWSGSMYATLFAFAVVGGWVLGGVFIWGFGDMYQLIINTFTTIATYLMVFLIQHTQNHDTKALHLKMDQLILGHKGSDNSFIHIENLTDEQLNQLSRRFQRIAESYHKTDE